MSLDLNTTWFFLVGVLLAGYAVFDGFDLGVGALHLLVVEDRDRRIFLNAIGPVWDGNEVWLVTGGGALFAAFPMVYATVFSGFYLALILLLAALIGRAVSFEFRSKVESPSWRRVWDRVFGIGSFLPALLFGVAVGNVMRGIPMDLAGNYTGTFFGLLNPFSLVMGLLSTAMFFTHGALWMAGKSDGELQARSLRFGRIAWVAWLVLLALGTVAVALGASDLLAVGIGRPLVWLVLLLMVVGHALVGAGLLKQRTGRTFLGSCIAVVAQVFLVGFSLYPMLVPALGEGTALDIYNASSTPMTLMVMLVIALLGMPVVIAYTVFIYRVFRGKVVLDDHSY